MPDDSTAQPESDFSYLWAALGGLAGFFALSWLAGYLARKTNARVRHPALLLAALALSVGLLVVGVVVWSALEISTNANSSPEMSVGASYLLGAVAALPVYAMGAYFTVSLAGLSTSSAFGSLLSRSVLALTALFVLTDVWGWLLEYQVTTGRRFGMANFWAVVFLVVVASNLVKRTRKDDKRAQAGAGDQPGSERARPKQEPQQPSSSSGVASWRVQACEIHPGDLIQVNGNLWTSVDTVSRDGSGQVVVASKYGKTRFRSVLPPSKVVTVR